jgi:hypothetical protein
MDRMRWCLYLTVSPFSEPAAHAVGGDTEIGIASHVAGVAKAAATTSATVSATDAGTAVEAAAAVGEAVGARL